MPSLNAIFHRDGLASESTMVVSFRRRNLSRLLFLFTFAFFIRLLFFPSVSKNSGSSHSSSEHQIKRHNFIERATRPDKSLNIQKHKFLQARMGRDYREGILGQTILNGVRDYWERFQEP
jgi:hypothetical protein